MTPEQIERAMEFVLTQQAQFVADLAQMREIQAASQSELRALVETVASMGETVSAVVSVVGDLAEHQRQTDERLAQVREDTDRRFGEVADTQREMGERVNTLIGVVERYFTRGNGGGPA